MLRTKKKRGYKIDEGTDIQVKILPVPFEKLSSMEQGESSVVIHERVIVQVVFYRNFDRSSGGAF